MTSSEFPPLLLQQVLLGLALANAVLVGKTGLTGNSIIATLPFEYVFPHYSGTSFDTQVCKHTCARSHLKSTEQLDQPGVPLAISGTSGVSAGSAASPLATANSVLKVEPAT